MPSIGMSSSEFWALVVFGMTIVTYGMTELVVREMVNAGAPLSGLSLPRGHRPLTLGFSPKPAEHLAIAYLRGGNRGVAEALLCAAIAGSWLYPWEGGYYRANLGMPHESTLCRFIATIRVGFYAPAQLAELAGMHATLYEPGLVEELERAGLMAPAAVRRRVKWVRFTPLIPILVGEAIPVFGRSAEAGPPNAFLTWAMVLATLFVILAATRARVPVRTVAKAYLEWLDAATTSLQQDVGAGRRRHFEEVTLAVAARGLSVLALVPAFSAFGGPLDVVYEPAAGRSGNCGGDGDGGCGGCGGGCGGGD